MLPTLLNIVGNFKQIFLHLVKRRRELATIVGHSLVYPHQLVARRSKAAALAMLRTPKTLMCRSADLSQSIGVLLFKQ
jgi:hypothetical protein